MKATSDAVPHEDVMIEDAELLRRFSEENAEGAFAELVQRRIGLVYAVALRQVRGDAHRAEDVVQMVFSDLARKAAKLCRRPVLIGWLHRAAQYIAIDLIRAEQRRLVREQKAGTREVFAMNDAPESDWTAVRPLLDHALSELHERERDAVLLRFFDGRSYADIGSRLQLSENAARMRVGRAVDKLHALLARRGVTSTTAAVSAALATQAATAAPIGLAASVASGALAATGAVSAGMAAISFMSTIKVQATVATALALAGGIGIVRQSQANEALRDEITRLRPQASAVEALQQENARLARETAEMDRLRLTSGEVNRLRSELLAAKMRQEQASRPTTQRAAAPPSQPPSQPIYALDELQQRPNPRRTARPQYPPEFRKAGLEGEATVALIIKPGGEVSEVDAVEASHPAFAAAAVEAVRKWQFDPGMKDGMPVNVRMMIPIRFTLNHDLPPEEWLKNWF